MRFALVVSALLALSACQQQGQPPAPLIDARTDEAAAPWTSLTPQDGNADFHFVVVTDRTGGHRPGVFSGAMPKVNLLAPAFVVSVGDLIEGYTDNQTRLDDEWDEMETFIDQLDAPFFYAVGNHDMSNAVMAETWRRRFGPSYYHFKYKGVLFLVLNSELFGMVGAPDTPVPGPWKQDDQMRFVQNVLADNADARWTVVLLHQPLWDADEINKDWLQIETLLGDRNYTVFAGHLHRYSRHRRHDRNFITLATTGGVSSLRGPVFGEFDHVAWVTMTDDGPRIANVMLDGIYDEDVSNPEVRAAAEAVAKSLTLLPAMGSGESFTHAQQTVRITNPGASDLTVSPVIAMPGNFDIRGLRPATLAPGTTLDLPLTLSAPEPVLYRRLSAAAVDWTLTTSIEDRPVQITTRTALLPLTRYVIPRATVAPVIDGSLSDWRELPYVVDHQGDVASAPVSPDDVSFRFGVCQDATALYLAIEVVDDTVMTDPNLIPRDQDAIVIAVDPRDEAARNRSMSVGEAVVGGDLARTVMTMLTVGPAAEDRLLAFTKETDDAAAFRTARTTNGYQAEIAIPNHLLDAKAGGGPWRDARIAISVYDNDPGEHGATVLHWQPNRYGSAPVPGSHTFTRGDADPAN